MKNIKGREFIIVICLLLMIAVLYFANKWDNERQEEYQKTEIDSKDYYSLLIKYKYVKGSVLGQDFKEKLKKAFGDSVVSRQEFKTLTGEETKIELGESPEKVHLYQGAKDQLIKLIQE